MRPFISSLCKAFSIFLIPLLLSFHAHAQNERIEINPVEFVGNNYFIQIAPVTENSSQDPANHKCCTDAPPSQVSITIQNGTVSIRSEQLDHWFNADFEFDQEEDDDDFVFDPDYFKLDGENSSTIAGFDNVRTTFSIEIYEDVIDVEATLGADGELFGETLVYNLSIDPGSVFTDSLCDEQCRTDSCGDQCSDIAPKVVSGFCNSSSGSSSCSTDAEFSMKVTNSDNKASVNSASVSQNVTISTIITPDAADVGKLADVFIVDWLFPSLFTMRNEDGNFVTWPSQSLKTLEPYLSGITLGQQLTLTLFSGTLGSVGQHRIFVAYMVEGGDLILTPAALQFEVTEAP